MGSETSRNDRGVAMQLRYQVRIRHLEQPHAFALRLNALRGMSPAATGQRRATDAELAIGGSRLAGMRDRQAAPAAGPSEWL